MLETSPSEKLRFKRTRPALPPRRARRDGLSRTTIVVLSSLLLMGSAGARPQLIATLGPSTPDVSTIRGLLRAGIAVARINLSHGDAHSAGVLAAHHRAASRAVGRSAPLFMGLPGGKVRLGEVPEGQHPTLVAGEPFTLSAGQRHASSSKRAWVNYPELANHVVAGDVVKLDDGKVVLHVQGAQDGQVVTRVEKGGVLRSGLGLLVEDKELPFPAMTALDRRKLALAVRLGADMVGVSFVQHPRNIQAVRRELLRLGAPEMMVVAKIESRSGMANLGAILKVADGLMIARGDLGTAVTAEGLPHAQHLIASRARAQGKPFITATGFASGMFAGTALSTENIGDIQRAARQGAAFLMLNETAIAPNPVGIVTAVRQVLDGERISHPN